ncbi:hypothetical protein COY95_02870 [Candidatus Woesearchaeota archaeon CG_4_10_14_0_8_um_filter_47_5]|nr:MAG: hypothetical protein COY95_02870 [Candidatus Woesearchaeota archaeon CG_4_10_14_0_8_um_filter_47_5]
MVIKKLMESEWKGVAPLTPGFMLVSIIGLVISGTVIYGRISKPWGFTFAVFFTIMLVASLVSMTYGPEHMLFLRKPRKKRT